MLDNTIKSQLKTYLKLLRQPIKLVTSSEATVEMLEFLDDIASLSNKITVENSTQHKSLASFTIQSEAVTSGVRFAALPVGQLLTPLILATLWTGGHPPVYAEELIKNIKGINSDHNFDVYVSQSCTNGPIVIEALVLMCVFNPKIKVTIIDGALFTAEVEFLGIEVVPTIYHNNAFFAQGRMTLEEILAKLD